MNRGDKSNTVEDNFDGSSPSTNTGGEAQKDPKQVAIEKAKQKAKATVNNAKPGVVDPKIAEQIEAQHRPQTDLKLPEWNPNSKWAGPARFIQAVPVVRKTAEKFVEAGRQYSAADQLIKIKEFPKIKPTGNYLVDLERDQLLIDGYGKELSILDSAEAGEREKDATYEKSKKLIETHLAKIQRDGKHNLKGNREFLLKKLSSPKEERMYSSLNLLYLYCDEN